MSDPAANTEPRRPVYKGAFSVNHPDTVAVYCSDGRFTGFVETLLSDSLGKDRLDVLAIPGGPALLEANWAVKFFEAETVRSALHFLIDGHKIKMVVLVAHQSCGFYRERYPMLSKEEVRKVQESDLRRARDALRSAKPVTVSCFYASVESQGVMFSEVE